MASFSVTVTPDASDGTTAYVSGRFTGGQSSYSYSKLMYITVDGVGTFQAWSKETSGGENTFSLTLTGLTAGTTYSWHASLYVRVTGGWDASGYTDSGTFTTASGSGGGGTTTSGVVLINRSSTGVASWVEAVPLINRSTNGTANWVEASALINRAAGSASWVETIGTS